MDSQTHQGLTSLSASELSDLLRSGEVSPWEALTACELQVAACEPALNALPIQCFDRAKALLNGKPSSYWRKTILGGMPICVKDLTAVSNVRLTLGTVGLRNYVAPANDPVVDRLEASGALIVAKSNTPEMGAGNVTDNMVFGPTKNPWNIDFSPGGSSGGSCAAVAAREVWLAQGTDLAGSLRNPAAYCGVVALRPTPGRTGSGPSSVIFNTETVQGPIGRTVEDVALGLDAMVGFDPRAPISLERPTTTYRQLVREVGDEKFRFAFSPTLGGFAAVESEIATATSSAVEILARNGQEIENSDPDTSELYSVYTVLRSMLWGSGPGMRPNNITRHYKKSLIDNIENAKSISSQEIFKALSNRSILYEKMVEFFGKFDVLICPVIGKGPGDPRSERPSQIAGEAIDDYVDWLRFSFLAPAAFLPAISVPIGIDASGIPIGIQLIGPPRGEEILLRSARVVERSAGLTLSPSPTAYTNPTVR